MAKRKTRGVRIHQFGGPDVLHIEDTLVDEPGLGEVRLDIRAIGLNRTEVTLRSGRSPIKPSLPTSIGWEAAGVIDELAVRRSSRSCSSIRRSTVRPLLRGSYRTGSLPRCDSR
jgi:NADPH:quinone reductase-like Zn-dependent oxidoreductase